MSDQDYENGCGTLPLSAASSAQEPGRTSAAADRPAGSESRLSSVCRRLVSWWRGVGLLALFVAVLWGPDAWFALAAHTGHGQYGTWTITEVRCVQHCRAFGDFVPDGSGPGRPHCQLAGLDVAPRPEHVGNQWRAIDVGAWDDEVYAPGSAKAFSAVPIFLTASAVFTVWLLTVVAPLLRNRFTPGKAPRRRTGTQ